MIDIIIANRKNINDRIKEQRDLFCVVAISNPFPDTVQYHISNQMRGLLRLEFWDADSRTCSDMSQLFNVQKKEAFIAFIDAMFLCEVKSILVHCDHGRSRSVALALALVKHYGEDSFQILNWEDYFTPNQYILSFFNI